MKESQRSSNKPILVPFLMSPLELTVIGGPCLRQIHPASVSFEALDKEESER